VILRVSIAGVQSEGCTCTCTRALHDLDTGLREVLVGSAEEGRIAGGSNFAEVFSIEFFAEIKARISNAAARMLLFTIEMQGDESEFSVHVKKKLRVSLGKEHTVVLESSEYLWARNRVIVTMMPEQVHTNVCDEMKRLESENTKIRTSSASPYRLAA